MDFELNLTTESIRQALPQKPLCVEPSQSVRDVLEIMREHDRSAALVCRAGSLVGMFTERDALRLLARDADLSVPIERVMVWPVVSLSEDDTVGKAIAKMSYGGYRRLPTVDREGKPTGLVKAAGILHYLVEHFPKVVYTLPPKPHHRMQEREGA